MPNPVYDIGSNTAQIHLTTFYKMRKLIFYTSVKMIALFLREND